MNGSSDKITPIRIAPSSKLSPSEKVTTSDPLQIPSHNDRIDYEFYQSAAGGSDSQSNQGTMDVYGTREQKGSYSDNHLISARSSSSNKGPTASSYPLYPFQSTPTPPPPLPTSSSSISNYHSLASDNSSDGSRVYLVNQSTVELLTDTSSAVTNSASDNTTATTTIAQGELFNINLSGEKLTHTNNTTSGAFSNTALNAAPKADDILTNQFGGNFQNSSINSIYGSSNNNSTNSNLEGYTYSYDEGSSSLNVNNTNNNDDLNNTYHQQNGGLNTSSLLSDTQRSNVTSYFLRDSSEQNTMGWKDIPANEESNTGRFNEKSSFQSILSSISSSLSSSPLDSSSRGGNRDNDIPSSATSNNKLLLQTYSGNSNDNNNNNITIPDSTNHGNNLTNTSNQTSSYWDYYDIKNISFVERLPGGLFPGPGETHGNNYTLCDWNVSLCYNFTGNATLEPPNGTYDDSLSGSSNGGQNYWKLFLLIFPLFTVFGNILVVLSVYKERSLRTVTNYFIVSLAVADIMVSVLVMPLAVYVEVNLGVWNIGNIFCDTWVALDVMCCTASILNLTAISIDRFIAVTKPISYAKHKGSNRIYIMLGLVWAVSIGISSPIALGSNYTEMRKPEMCTFYNADFIIYSSMGSFIIPCIVMIVLYWRIFKAIRDRARKKVAKKPKSTLTADANSCYRNVIENKAQTTRTSSDASNTEENGNGTTIHNKTELTQVNDGSSGNFIRMPSNLSHTKLPGNSIETSFTNYNAKFSGTDETDIDQHQPLQHQQSSHSFTSAAGTPQDGGIIESMKSPTSEDTEQDHVPDHIIANQKLLLSPTSEEDTKSERERDGDCDSGYTAPTCVEVDISNKVLSPTSTFSNKALLSPLPHRKAFGLYKEYKPGKKKKFLSSSNKHDDNDNHNNGTPTKKYVTKFNFHLRHSKKKKTEVSRGSRAASKRERKATKTLAIVLGVFLVCWVPFFTINIMSAICIRYKLFDRPECQLNENLFSLFVWLGYINSFLNPVIYTIFNIEFRKAFKKLLKHPCK